MIFEVIGGYWPNIIGAFVGVLGDLEDCWLVLGFVLGSWRVRGSQRLDHRGISRSLGPQEGFCEGDIKVFVRPK